MLHHLLPDGVIVGAAALALSACGSSYGTATSNASPSAATGATGAPISVEQQNFQFSPATLSLPANTLVTLTIRNTGSKAHNFSIDEYSVSRDVSAGGTDTVTFTTKGDASLQFYCKFHRDSAGMAGTAKVGAGGAAAPATPKGTPSPYHPYG